MVGRASSASFGISFQFAWHYKERHRGKGAMNGVGDKVKNNVSRDVKPSKVQITSPECFANYTDKFIHRIQCVSVTVDEIMEEPADVANESTLMVL